MLETKYRDIADGNILSPRTTWISGSSDTKYRDIADGNGMLGFVNSGSLFVENQVPKNSSRKPYISGSP